MAGDDLIEELMAGMEIVKIPSDILDREDSMKLESVDLLSSPASSEMLHHSASQQQQQEPPLSSMNGSISGPRRPMDNLREAGPPADPVAFDPPVIARGRREDVLCYNPKTQKHDVCKNVLFHDYSHEMMGADDDESLSCVQRAYWTVPLKEPIKTIMGHVNICLVLERCLCEQDESSIDSRNSDDDGEEDIVFRMTNQYVAVKVNYYDRMERLRNRHAEDPLKEIAAMQLIGENHPNVMGVSEVLFDGKNLNVVMPYCGSGDLFQMLQDCQGMNSNTPGLTEPQARFWFRQIMNGLKHMHSVGVCHRDLSPENLMLDGKGCLIIDMGMCLRIPYTDPNDSSAVTDIAKGTRQRLVKPQGTCGKLPYMSPEIYRNRDAFDAGAIDVWTAGTILFCMITGNRSYQRPHNTDPQFYWMTQGMPMLLKDWGVPISDQGQDLLKGMLQADPRLRLTIDEVLNHAWFSGPDEAMPQARS